MLVRHFEDRDGERWRVWVIRPTDVFNERRQPPSDRRQVDAEDAPDPPVLDRRAGSERRVPGVSGPRQRASNVLPELWRAGWLVFEPDGDAPLASTRAARRLAPVPDDWTTCANDRLADYLERTLRHPRSGA